MLGKLNQAKARTNKTNKCCDHGGDGRQSIRRTRIFVDDIPRQSFLWIVLLCVCSNNSYGQRPSPVSSRHNHPTNGCLFESVWYRVGQSIRHVHDGRWCSFLYCGEEGVVREWESSTCDPTMTVQKIMNSRHIGRPSSSRGSQKIPPPPPEVPREGQSSEPVRESWIRASQPRALSSGTVAGSTVSRSKTTSDNVHNEGCIRGPSTFFPGDVMSERQVGNMCTITYCDTNSQVQQVSRPCSAPHTRPPVFESSSVTVAPVQSTMSLFDQNIMALSLLKMLRR